MFVINNEIFIAFANFYNSAQSTMFKLSGERFAKLQSFQTNRTRDVSSFNIDGETILVFANDNNIDSFIYKWNGSRFVLFQSIPAGRATACSPFVMCGQTYLGMASFVFGEILLYTSSLEHSSSNTKSFHLRERLILRHLCTKVTLTW